MVIPISGFLPVPLPMMIPFMGAQSLVIGKMFGEGFQYGKRKISAMTNEEFNKLTFEDMMSNARIELRNSIPTMNGALQDMKPMVDVVVREFLQYINEVSKTLQAVTVTGLEQGAHALGTHVPGAHPEVSTTQITPSPIIEQGALSPPPLTFPKAKVSKQTLQKERNLIIQQIVIAGNRVKALRTRSSSPQGKRDYEHALRTLKSHQQRLVVILNKLR